MGLDWQPRQNKIEEIAKQSMLKTYTADELNALADFYTSKHGASAMNKMGEYLREMLPQLMQETQRAIKEAQEKQK